MKIAYIVGPYRAETIWEVRQNILAAEHLAGLAARMGYFPYCPHKNTAFFDGLSADALWLEGNLELIRRVKPDIAILRWNYFRSEGSCAEVNFLQSLGTPCVTENYARSENLRRDDALLEMIRSTYE